ncbi:MAG: IS4 family transposase, partial [Betaproteobacteria bacterium]
MQANQDWAHMNFGNCQLGDKRRTARLIQVATHVANNPSASFPDQMPTWTDLKAAYDLFDGDDVTFEAIARPHWEQTKQCAAGRYLVIGDTTELDFGRHRDVPGLGPTGNGGGLGFLLHNGLLVAADSKEVIGVAGQTIHYRAEAKASKKKSKQKENSTARLKRDRESEVWGKVIDQVGRPPEGVEWIHVLDRGGDNFEVYCHLQQQRCGWVVRAGKLNRYVLAGSAEKRMKLSNYLPQLELLGTYELSLRARPGQPARTAQLEVRVGSIKMPVPHHQSPWVRELDPEPIAMNVVQVVEVNAPAGVEPICWVLLTSLPVETFEEAWQVIEYYEARWLVEEYHKALKTGCRVTDRQLKTAGRLEAMLGLMSVVAVRLLRLKSLARTSPETPAQRVVPRVWLAMLKAARKGLHRVHDLTVGQFYREVAKLGGFLGRKGDGDPGWITIWRGWEKLNN